MSRIIIQRDDCVITLNTPEYINDRKALSALVARIAADIYGQGAKVSFSHDDFDGGSVVDEIDISENGLYDDYSVQDIDEAWELPGGDIDDKGEIDEDDCYDDYATQDADEAWELAGGDIDDDDDL